MAQNNLKIHPSVDAIIKPIVYDMTKIDISQKTNPIIGKNNEPDFVKEIKKRCVHIIYDNGEYRPAVKKNENGELVCTACGRNRYNHGCNRCCKSACILRSPQWS